MLKSYLKIAWRNLLKSKFFSAINILGLAAGMAVALLIGLWVYHEYSYDKFLPDYNRLYRVQRNFDSNGDTLTFATTSLKLADALRNQIQEIEYVAESDWTVSHGLTVGETKIYINGQPVGSDFLKMFEYPLLVGNSKTVLQDPYSIVLTESTAKALFGDEDPINKMVRFDNKNDLKVTGLLKDLPSNSTFQFNFLVPFSYLDQTSANVRENRAGSFANNAYQQFVKLKPGVSYAQVAQKIRNIQHTETGNSNSMKSYVFLQPMQNWHLYSNFENGKEKEGFMEYVRMFSIIGALVLLIACINFINITTARSEKRAREVGVRKAIGSGRKELIFQFLAESFLLVFIAFIFSLLFAQLSLNGFNTLIGGKINIPYTNPVFWSVVLASVFITALIAGSRPAFYLSSFRPVKVLKGVMKSGRSVTLPRKVLVVVQFVCSIALIISTVIIYQQIQHVKNRPTGYNINRLMMTNLNSDLKANYTTVKNEMIQKGIVESVTTASSPADNVYWHGDIDNWPGKNANETVEMGFIIVGDDYFKTLGMKLREGKNFAGDFDTTNVIFNETAIARMRLKNPVNQIITWGGTQYRIIGVVKDALMISPFTSADPAMFFTAPRQQGQGRFMYKLNPAVKTQDAIAQLTTIFNKYNPEFPYNYQFADESYARKFKLEVLVGKLSGIFAALAIFISCLGLFGLAAFIAEQRTKEIAIRKVLGASVQQVWLLLSKEFIVLVLIGSLIASPVALYFLQNWLEKYQYKITIGPGVFIGAAIVAIIITILTISFQAIKAAIANPVKSLRTE